MNPEIHTPDTDPMTPTEAAPKKRRGLRLLLIGAGLGVAFTGGTLLMDQFTSSASAATLPVDAAAVQTVSAPDAGVLPLDAGAAAEAGLDAVATAQAPAEQAAASAGDDLSAPADSDGGIATEGADPSSASAGETTYYEETYYEAPSAPAAPAASGGNGTDFTLYADGYCGDPSCAQSAVDSSSLALVDYGTGYTAFSGHNFGPAGIIASMGVGNTVTIEGVGAGIYQITGTQYVSVYATTDEVSGLALQTCVGSDQMVIHYITQIG